MKPFEVIFKGYVNINNHEIPIEYKMTIIAINEDAAKALAYDIAKRAELSWDYVIK